MVWPRAMDNQNYIPLPRVEDLWDRQKLDEDVVKQMEHLRVLNEKNREHGSDS